MTRRASARRWTFLWIAALGLACDRDPVAVLQDCETNACRAEHIDAVYQQDPGEARAFVVALNDPITTAALVEQLAARHPGQSRTICDWLEPSSLGYQRCRRNHDRPHLVAGNLQKNARGPSGEGIGSGPRSADLPVPDLGPAEWQNATAAEQQQALGPCAGASDPSCIANRAQEYSSNGDVNTAGMICLAGHSGADPGYSECLFRAAEARARAQRTDGLVDAYHLCAASNFGPMCFAHVLQFNAPPPPPADSPDPKEIAKARAIAEAVADVVSNDPAARTAHVDRYWAVWVHSAFRIAGVVTGDLLDVLPPEAVPHIRASAAYRYLRDSSAEGLHYDRTVEAVRTRLTARSGQAASANSRTPLVNLRTEFWTDVRQDEHAIPTAYLMGPGRRAVSSDVEVDLRIAVLEAAAQLDPPPPAEFFLSMVGTDEHPLVRWTGARIGGLMSPEAASKLSDDSALVRGRLGAGHTP